MTTLATPADLAPARRPYQPFGAAQELLYNHAPELMISGPAGTGKSRGSLEKLHLCAEKYAGMRGLIVRKTRASLTESALVTFEEKVLPAHHPVLQSGGQRLMRQAYHYLNGSSIVVGGMDNPSRTLSTEYDIIFVQEAIELTENDWELLTRPLRNGVMPYQQLYGDTNPHSPSHWLKQRETAGRIKFLESRHEDNPVLWNARQGAWTPFGATYIATLDRLTGVRKERLRWGRWVQAEGVVYDGWDRRVHLIDQLSRIPNEWPRYWSIDFGFTNPFVAQWWCQDPDGRLYRYREIYRTQRLVEDHAREILRLSGWKLEGGTWRPLRNQEAPEPRPRAIICDHDAEGRATLSRYLGMTTVAARKEIQRGVQAVASRLQVAGDGKPRLFLMRDSLVEIDEALKLKSAPLCTEDEIESYVWNRQTPRREEGNNNARKRWEEPVDRDNHGLDALRYLVAHLDFTGQINTAPPRVMGGYPTMGGYH